MEKDLVCVAKVASPHGVRGAVKLKAYTADPASLADYSPLYNKNGSKEFRIRILSTKNEMVTVKIEGIESRDEVAKLTNTELYADKNLFEELEEDEFYYSDLIGMEVFTVDGKKFGVIINIDDYGSGDVVEISLESGSHEMFPFDKKTFPEVSIKENRVIIIPPEVEFVVDNDNDKEGGE